MEGFWSLLRSWLRPHRGISQEKLPVYLGFFEFVHNVRKRGKALLANRKNNSIFAPPPRQHTPSPTRWRTRPTHGPAPRLFPRAQGSTAAPPERAGPRAGAAQHGYSGLDRRRKGRTARGDTSGVARGTLGGTRPPSPSHGCPHGMRYCRFGNVVVGTRGATAVANESAALQIVDRARHKCVRGIDREHIEIDHCRI